MIVANYNNQRLMAVPIDRALSWAMGEADTPLQAAAALGLTLDCGAKKPMRYFLPRPL
jgi:hypothetical protein